MRIRVLSDLHHEFFLDKGRAFRDLLPVDCDVLVLAGDISTECIGTALAHFCDRFRHVVYVLGNHEFYGSSVSRTLDRIEKLNHGIHNLHWLENTSVELGGVRFVGGTLWFPKPTTDKGKWGMTDFHVIREFEPWVYAQNMATRAYLQQTVGPSTVVVTHHLPSYRSVHPKYRGSSLNRFFVGDDMTVRPRLWIHGHTHESMDYTVGNTRVVCNPYGYFGQEENPQFDPGFTVEI